MSKIEFKTNYEIVPISELPKEPGTYWFQNGNLDPKEIEIKDISEEFVRYRIKNYSHWLRPKASSVVLSADELRKIIDDTWEQADTYKGFVTSSELEGMKKEWIDKILNPQP